MRGRVRVRVSSRESSSRPPTFSPMLVCAWLGVGVGLGVRVGVGAGLGLGLGLGLVVLVCAWRSLRFSEVSFSAAACLLG